MLALASSQVEVSDQTDPFISRYKTPDFSVSNDVDTSGQTSSNIKVLTWAGLISSQWILEILFTLM